MGDSGEGSDAYDSAESSASAGGIDSGDDSSAYGGEYAGDGFDSGTEFPDQTDPGESGDGGDDSSAYGGIEVSVDTPNEVDTGVPDEVAVELPAEIGSETPAEINSDGEGDEESAYGQDAVEQEEDGKDEQNPEVPVEQDMEKNENETENETGTEELSEEELEVLQEQADNAAQEYNDKFSPYERAVSKGVEGVMETPNGGVSFENSEAIYVTADGEKAIVTIEATGSRSADFDQANKELGLSETPDGYTWHHVDNYNVKNNTITMEFVRSDAHKSAMPHSGGCAQYDAVHGPSYNPPK